MELQKQKLRYGAGGVHSVVLVIALLFSEMSLCTLSQMGTCTYMIFHFFFCPSRLRNDIHMYLVHTVKRLEKKEKPIK